MSAGLEAMDVEADITMEDVKRYAHFVFFESPAGTRVLRKRQAFIFVLMLLPGGLNAAKDLSQGYIAAAVLSLMMVLAVATVAAYFGTNLQRRDAADKVVSEALIAGVPGHWQYTFDSAGMEFQHPKGSDRIPWSELARVERSCDAVYVFKAKREQVFMLPNRAFSDAHAKDDFVRYLSEMIADAHSVPGRTSAST